jgi:PAS domain S-box-containing protein
MPRFKVALFILFASIFCALAWLGYLSYRLRGAGFQEETTLLLIGIFLLTSLLLFTIIYHFEKRKGIERRLRESEERFRLFVRHVKDYAIFMIDPGGQVLSWNEGARQIKGYSEEEIIGKPISVFYTDEEILQQEPAFNLKKAAEDGRYECIAMRKRKDGTVFWADIIFTALYDEDNKLRGYVKITRDITDQRKAEEEIRNNLQKERELNEMKSRFVSLASHEFKTPLSVILSSVSLISKYDETGDHGKLLTHVHRIKANVSNLKQILDDFLSAEKLDAGLVVLRPSLLNLRNFIQEIVNDFQDACKPGQQIYWEAQGDLPTITLDGHLLRNILVNLLSNAIKYSPGNSPIRLTACANPASLTIRVEDSGIGIPPEDLPRLFQRFFRGENTAGTSGTGLGLSIVKKYVDLMSGTIEVSSIVREGTTFTVILPQQAAGTPC